MNRAPDWFAPWRMPYADRHLHHPMLVAVAGCPAGVRLRFTTDTTSIAVHVEHRQLPGFELPHTPMYDLTVDGALVGSAAEPTFTGLAARDKVVEIWLPQIPGVRIRGLAVDDGATVAPVADRRPRWVAYLDGRELFGEHDLDHLPDGLHPDTEGYRRIGERFAARH